MLHKERMTASEEVVNRNKQVAVQREIEFSRKDWLMSLVFIAGLIAAVLTMLFFDQTIISPLFWLPIIGLSIILVLISLAGANKIALWEKLILGVSIGMLMALGFLIVNYHYADWNKKPEICTYKVVETGVDYGRYADSYRLRINLGDMEKDIIFKPKEGYDERILSSRTVQLCLYQGRLGYKVYKDKLAQ